MKHFATLPLLAIALFAAACSEVRRAQTGTTSWRRVMKTILFAFGRSIPAAVPLMKRRTTTPRPLDVIVVSRKSTFPCSSTLMFS